MRLARFISAVGGKSRYTLRKNQKEACLCTAECVIEVLRSVGDAATADRLEEGFLAFIRQSGAKQSPTNEAEDPVYESVGA